MEPFANLCHVSGIELQRTGIKAHSSLNLGENYHHPLCIIYRKLRTEHPSSNKHLNLELTIKAINNTLGPDGVVSSTLVFGEHPPVSTRSEVPQMRPTLDERSKITLKTLQEMERQREKLRAECAL